MRSLTLKLTLAFLLVGVVGVITFAVLVGQRTRTEFDRYLSARDQAVLIDALSEYYATHQSWAGVAGTMASRPPLSMYSRSAVLADVNGVVVMGNYDHRTGEQLPPEALKSGTRVNAGGQFAGTILFTPRADTPGYPPGNPSEDALLERVTGAAVTSAIVTLLIALILGAILASTLTRPLGELTDATKAMAGGKLGLQVKVHSRDEIGVLATSFNHMSADLARASQLRKQMTADLAHDLRTPLSILRGYTEGLKDERLHGKPAVYQVMHDEVVHLQRLVEDLRTLSRADAGELVLNRRAVDPQALLERTGLAYVMQAEQRGLGLRVDAAEGLPSIAVDTDRMTQVLNNLVSNALRHTDRGEIVLSARADGQQVRLQVSDTGSGIEPEHLPFVFDRFYRADPSRQRDGEADDDTSGLGLAIAKAIVEAHGGTIAVESTPGHGTTFNLCLPVAR